MPLESREKLRTRLRLLIGDRGSSPYFEEDDLDSFLDAAQISIVSEKLEPLRSAGGEFLSYRGPAYFDDYAQITDRLGEDVTPANSSRPIAGSWTFESAVAGNELYVTGVRFDIYTAAAQALRTWAAGLKLEYDVGVSGDSFSRSQKVSNLLELASEYEAQSEGGGAVSGGTPGAADFERYDWEEV